MLPPYFLCLLFFAIFVEKIFRELIFPRGVGVTLFTTVHHHDSLELVSRRIGSSKNDLLFSYTVQKSSFTTEKI